MLKDILADHNVLRGNGQKGFRGEKDLSVIVTERFMQRFGYSLDDPLVYLDLEVEDETIGKGRSLVVPVGVRAVVKEMPGKADVAYCEYFISAHNQKIGSPFDTRDKDHLKLLVFGDSLMANAVLKATKEYLTQAGEYFQYEPEATNYNRNNDTYKQAYEIQIGFWPAPERNSNVLNKMFIELMNSEQLSEYKGYVHRYYNYHDFEGRLNHRITYDMLSANFTDLEKVRAFSEYVRDNYNDQNDVILGSVIEADLAKIREKENFNFLSTIAYIISVLVVVFGVLSVSMFIANLLGNHLSKIQMNLGTFKAFGLSDKQTRSIYFVIILRFILVSLFVSSVLSLGFGKFIELLLAQVFQIEDSVQYFMLFDWKTVGSIGSIVLVGILVSWFTINKMLNKTPGDLIYNR